MTIQSVERQTPAGSVWAARQRLIPGLCLSALIAFSAESLGARTGGPSLLFALLIGIAFHFLSRNTSIEAGTRSAASSLIRVGVALLGVKVTVAEVIDLGWLPLLAAVVAIIASQLFAQLLAKYLGFDRTMGAIAGAAIGICGVSAALAASSVLPRRSGLERDTLLVCLGVSILSTIAMVAYPAVLTLMSWPVAQGGVFLGATIHDVAQVSAAGAILSPEYQHIAVVTKLMRVALLAPSVCLIAFMARDSGRETGRVTWLKAPPWFLQVFVALMALSSLGLIPAPVSHLCDAVSHWCMLIGVAALGLRTRLDALRETGWRALVLIGTTTIFLAVLIGALVSSVG